jgi:small basic protein
VLRVDLLFLFAIVFAMTVKPTGDDVGIVLVVAAILVAGTLFFLRDVVRPQPAPAR